MARRPHTALDPPIKEREAIAELGDERLKLLLRVVLHLRLMVGSNLSVVRPVDRAHIAIRAARILNQRLLHLDGQRVEEAKARRRRLVLLAPLGNRPVLISCWEI